MGGEQIVWTVVFIEVIMIGTNVNYDCVPPSPLIPKP